MIATGWLALRNWHELRGSAADGVVANLAVPYLRPALLFWLATLGDGEWVALDDLAAYLTGRYPEWDRLHLEPIPRDEAGNSPVPTRRRPASRGRSGSGSEPLPSDVNLLESILLGAAYPLGLVRAAEEEKSGRRVAQLTSLGRYVAGGRPDAAAPSDVRPVPVRAAELRDDRLSPGSDAPPGRPAQPVRLVVAARRRAGAEADARVDRIGTGGRPDARDHDRNARAAHPAVATGRRGRCDPDLGHATGTRHLLRGGDLDRVRLGGRPGPGAGVLAPR